MLTEDEYEIIKQHLVQQATEVEGRILIISLGKVFKLLEKFVAETIDENKNDNKS